MNLRFLLLFCAAIFCVLPQTAQAHLTPNSEVNVDFGADRIVVDVIIPQGEYAYATGNPVTNDAASLETARRFLKQNFRIFSADDRAWTMQVDSIEFVQIAGPPDLHAIVMAAPPEGMSARKMRFVWTAVTKDVPNHSVFFIARQDFSSGKVAENREVLGILQGTEKTLDIERGKPHMMSGFLSAVRLGMKHIAEGHDHLLFVIALLLPAPLLAARRAWQPHARPPRKTLWLVTKIVSSFTVGHSLTLIGAAFLGWRLPVQPVEIMIAVSILVSAIHAMVPIFPRREPVVAGLFGLVHGLAFATLIGHYGLGTSEKALTILGFNIGIEIVQLMVVLAVMPALLMFAATRYYPAIRLTLAIFIAGAATAWIIERVSGLSNIVGQTLDTMLSYGLYIIAGFTIVAALLYWLAKDRTILATRS